MTRPGGAEPPAPPGGFFPAVYDELKGLAAARLAGERAGHSAVALGISRATAFREWAYARSWLATTLRSGR